MRIALTASASGMAFFLAAVSLSAHHSFTAEFDAGKPIKVSGAVTKVEWKNPHVYFFVDVTDPSGSVANWAFEMGSPNGLMREGWTRNTLKIGDSVSVEGSRAKDGALLGNARVVVLASTGQRLFAATSQGNP